MEVADNRNEMVRRFFGRDSSYLEKDFGLRIRASVVHDFVGDVRDADILDVGCGDGSISRQFWTRNNRVTLVDLSAPMLERAQAAARPGAACELKFLQADILAQPLDQKFDLVLCLGVLAHVSSASNAVRVLGGLIKSGGCCILQFTDHGRITSRLMGLYQTLAMHGRAGYRVNRMSAKDVESWTRRAGLVAERFQRFDLTIPGVGRLPNELLYKFGMRTIQSPLLSSLSTGVIALYRKRQS